jgi:hypothetical protein
MDWTGGEPRRARRERGQATLLMLAVITLLLGAALVFFATRPRSTTPLCSVRWTKRSSVSPRRRLAKQPSSAPLAALGCTDAPTTIGREGLAIADSG